MKGHLQYENIINIKYEPRWETRLLAEEENKGILSTTINIMKLDKEEKRVSKTLGKR
jgi:hypothetical protein